jgi:transcriptional regulator with XRE-family HTH domain
MGADPEDGAVDVVRFGLGIRALRRKRAWTQKRLAAEAGVSRSVIERIERGRADRVAVHTLVRVAATLGSSISLKLLWQGEGLDRLLDASHADIVERVVRLLSTDGWEVTTEASFNVDGERGSIDVLAFHVATHALLVIEIKSVVPDIQATLHGLDRKFRVARRVAAQRGWEVRTVSRVLVLPDDRTSRRRVQAHRATFDAVMPARTVEIKRWLRAPADAVAGILFLSDDLHPVTRHRVSSRRVGLLASPRTDRGREEVGMSQMDPQAVI